MTNRIQSKLNSKAIQLLYQTGLQHLWMPKVRHQRIAFMYHGVVPQFDERFNLRHMDVKGFEQQLLYIRTYCQVISVSDFFALAPEQKGRYACITFDDGYWNNLQYALPLLERHQIPATFFVTSIRSSGLDRLWADVHDILGYFIPLGNKIQIEGCTFCKVAHRKFVELETQQALSDFIYAGGAGRMLTGCKALEAAAGFTLAEREDLYAFWKLMSEDQIRQCAGSKYITIGSHSHLHTLLGNTTLELATQELIHSKQYLEDCIQQPVDALAYPAGSYTPELIQVAEQVGYKQQLLVNYAFGEQGSDRRIHNRVGIYLERSREEVLNSIRKSLA